MRHTMIFLAAASLAACNSEAAEEAPAAAVAEAGAPAATAGTAAADMPTDAARYVEMAGASDLYEIQSSELALTKTQNADVRQFAEMMIEQHRMTTEQVTAAAEAAGLLAAPPELSPMQVDMIAQLEAASGEAFDQAYLQQQRQAHQMALALHQNFAEAGDSEELQQVANEAVPVIQGHITELETLNAG